MKNTILCLFFLLTFAFGSSEIKKQVNSLLKQGVHKGLLDYSLFKKNKGVLDKYIETLTVKLNKRQDNKEAFVDWINLYNVLTIQLIVEHYPKLKSILNLKKPWDTPIKTIKGEALSLNDIEHKKIRGVFKDYRIHFVLVCASIGCPDLRRSLYTYENIERELEEETKKYLNSSKGSELVGKRLHISKLFDWYKGDFKPSISSVLKKYITDSDKLEVINKSYGYLPYSWDLNTK